jgi:hypothetical protein
MSAGVPREDLIRRINLIFGPQSIGRTASRLGRLSPRADVFTILDELELLSIVTTSDVRRYRRELTIPKLNRQILTAAFRTALFGGGKPTPLALQIYSGEQEAVEVKTTDRLIEVTLIRIDPPRFRRPRPRR